MRITTLQWDTRQFDRLWAQAAGARADLLVLPELGFSPWLADSPQADPAAWAQSIAQHEQRIARLGELNAKVVVGSRPVAAADGTRFNEAFVWDDGRLRQPAHRKTYLPDEPGFWEASWYQRGPVDFEPVDTTAGRIGVMLCTEMWFFEHARALGRQGIDILVVPRATPSSSVGKWLAGGRAAAVTSGAFCVSANQCGDYRVASMGGGSWVIDPEEGDVLGLTEQHQPILTVDVDLARARQARATYPRYVKE